MELALRMDRWRFPALPVRWWIGLVLLLGCPAAMAAALDVAQIKAQAEAGHPKAQNTLGAMFNLGQEVPEDHAEAVKWFRKAAEKGEPEALYNLGTMYLNGRGVAKDPGEAVKWIRRAAEKGFAVAQFALGTMYQSGTGADKDLAEAGNWFFRAAEQGHPEAQYNLGTMYFQAKGVPQDYVSAHTLFCLAANRGLEKAADGRDVVASLLAPDQLKESLRRVATFKPKPPTEVVPPKVELPKVRQVKALESKAPPTAPAAPVSNIEALKSRAAKDDPEAQFELGVAYQAGREVSQDLVTAVKWFERAAQLSHGKAQRYLGSMYFQGQGVEQDFVAAYKWLALAAAQKVASAPEARDLVAGIMTEEQVARGKQLVAEFKGGKPGATAPATPAPAPAVSAPTPGAKASAPTGDVAVLLKRAQAHATGQGVPQDLVEAEKLFRQAADQGSAEAQSTLGIMYFHGRGVRQNKSEAIKWLKLAADQNRAPAQFWLGLADETLSDSERAAWYRKSAEQGYGPAQYHLATLYAAGQGVPQDYIEAYKWFTLSAGQGNAPARAVRDAAEQLMTAEQIAEGKRRADGFVPRVAAPPTR